MSMTVGYRVLSTLVCTFVFVSIATTHEITIRQRANVGNGQELGQGTYRVEVERNKDSAEVLFFQGGELVVAARATLIKEAAKCNNTEVHSEELDGQQVITKIWLQGWKESLVFKQGTPEAE
jgi:hypothetical protein